MTMLSNAAVLGADGGYTIANSLRLRASASAYLSRTPAGAGDRKTWTFSTWVKRGTLGNTEHLFGCDPNTTNQIHYICIDSSNRPSLYFENTSGAAYKSYVYTTAVLRDPSAWYHIVFVWDTTQATVANRHKFYVNGVQYSVTVDNLGSGQFPQNNDGFVSSTSAHWIGRTYANAYADSYRAEKIFVGGQALTPSSFGEFNSDGVWVPKAYTGTYGTNGFYLPFNDGSNLTNLCLDRSGNGTNWTATNVSLTGVTTDWMVDTPSVNYCTLNPLDSRGTNTLSAANLTYATGTTFGLNRSTFALTSGKWYWEVTGFSGIPGVGVSRTDVAVTSAGHDSANGWAYFGDTGNKWTNNSGAAYGATFGTTDVIGVALDMDAGTLTFYKNNVSQGVAFSSGLLGQSLSPMLTSGLNSSGGSFNFGQRPFQYSPPSGFGPLNTSRMPAQTVTNGRRHFDVLLHTGNSTTNNVTGSQFQPDLVWVKNRGAANGHNLFDVIRGAGMVLSSNTTGSEVNNTANMTGFLSNGFSLASNGGDTNLSGNTYVDWLWKAGGTAVTNTAGSITSQVSANTTAGISVVTWTGTLTAAGAVTIGHGLGVSRVLTISKSRNPNGADTGNWFVQHPDFAANKFLQLNTTSALLDSVGTGGGALALPTSSVFSRTWNSGGAITGNNYVAYCFAEVPGFSRFGSVTMNAAADGAYFDTGFDTALMMMKRTDSTSNWIMVDTVRQTYNVMGPELYPNLSNAEAVVTELDFTSRGIKFRNASLTGTWIIAAWARNPSGGSNVAPVTAR